MNEEKKIEKLDRIYRKKLGRPLDQAGYQSFKSSGFNLDTVIKDIKATDEFKQKQSAFEQLQQQAKDLPKDPVVGRHKARELQKSTYSTPYTEESFTKEYQALNRGATPDQSTIKNWVRNGLGVGQYTAETKYDRANVITIMVDKKGDRITDPSMKAARVYKIHKDANAFKEHYGSGLHQLGEDRKGVINLVPTEGVKAVGRQSNLAKYGAIDPRYGFGNMLKRYGLNPEQNSITQVTRPAPKRGFFQHSIPHQLAQATGIKEFNRIKLGDAFTAAVWGPGLYLGAKAAEKWSPNGIGRYFNTGILKKGADPFEVQGDVLQEGYSSEADKATAEALNTSVQNINKVDAVVSVLGDAAITYFTGGLGGAYVAAKHAAQDTNRYAAGQMTTGAYLKGLGWSAAGAGLSLASLSPYFQQSSALTAGLTATQVATNVAQSRSYGSSWNDALLNAAWAQTGYGRFARPLVDRQYAERMRKDPSALASYLSSAGIAAYSAYRGGAPQTTWLQRKGMEWGYGRVNPSTGKYESGFYNNPEQPRGYDPGYEQYEPGFWNDMRSGLRAESNRVAQRFYNMKDRSSLQSNKERPTNSTVRDPWSLDFNPR